MASKMNKSTLIWGKEKERVYLDKISNSDWDKANAAINKAIGYGLYQIHVKTRAEAAVKKCKADKNYKGAYCKIGEISGKYVFRIKNQPGILKYVTDVTLVEDISKEKKKPAILNMSVHDILANKTMKELFYKQLKKIHSENELVFFEAASKNITKPENKQAVYEMFIRDGAKFGVNVGNQKAVLDGLAATNSYGDMDLKPAAKQVYNFILQNERTTFLNAFVKKM